MCGGQTIFQELKGFLPSKGFYSVSSAPHLPQNYKACDPSYRGACPPGDIALLELDSAVDGISAVPVTRAIPVPVGDTGTIVGYGTTSGTKFDFGVKRKGAVVAASCRGVPGADDESWLCWRYISGARATDCHADSGGPYLASNGAVGGISSGAIGQDPCGSGASVFDTRIRHYTDWLTQTGGYDIKAGACGSGPQVGTPAAPVVQIVNDKYKADGRPSLHNVTVDQGVATLQLAVSGSGPHFYNVTAMSLSVRRVGASETPDNRCEPQIVENFGHCAIDSPEPDGSPSESGFKSLRSPDQEFPFVYQVIATEVMKSPPVGPQ